jgi:YrbI family 3-deoxy-D-manno-octulosonate 8-phosphate phosphatase
MNLEQRCKTIQLILSDVDGVMTDGMLVFDNQGIESKRFHVRDGTGIKLWRRAGGQFGIITARTSHVVEVRSGELGIDIVRQGVDHKVSTVKAVLKELNLKPEQAAYIGDDLLDLGCVQFVGLGVAVADACEELRGVADLVTELPGGRGAVRETIETILKSQRRWDDLVASYQS